MIIIGILAAIAIPVFLSQRAKAQDSAAKADVSTIGKEIATYFVDNTAVPTIDTTTNANRYTLTVAAVAASGSAPAVPAIATDLGKESTNVALTPAVSGAGITDATHWCVSTTNSTGSQKVYKYSARGGLAAGACTSTDVG